MVWGFDSRLSSSGSVGLIGEFVSLGEVTEKFIYEESLKRADSVGMWGGWYCRF